MNKYSTLKLIEWNEKTLLSGSFVFLSIYFYIFKHYFYLINLLLYIFIYIFINVKQLLFHVFTMWHFSQYNFCNMSIIELNTCKRVLPRYICHYY